MSNIDNIINKKIISSILNEDDSILNCYLEESGYNVSDIDKIASKKYKREIMLLEGTIEKQKNEKLLEKAKMFQEAINKNIEKPVNFLMNLLKNNEFQVQYRNLENLSIDEIKDIIKDQNLLDIIENLDEEE